MTALEMRRLSGRAGSSLAALLFAPVLVLLPGVAHADNGWSEAQRGSPLVLGTSKLAFEDLFNTPHTLNGPILWAKQHADVGLETFDPAGAAAYSIAGGVLKLRAYQAADGIHSGNVQSTNANQAYQGAQIVPGRNGFTCVGCYFEVRAQFPNARGTWGAFWLLTPDDPRRRGHLEVDAIEYFGAGDKRGHHHSIHRWGPQEPGGHAKRSDYTGMDAIADFGWHLYGVDLRGIAEIDGKPALVVYMDRKEVARIAADADFFTRPFYFNMTLSINPQDSVRTLPQTVSFDDLRVYK
ncbi:glycoside hydrolase family 16 protein [Sphingomonas sp. H39-1-10]|nr:glycoside hydrolase family 16 protein [Sphingomonas pollutisoli]MDF0486566.1 glycoside hydrolase family 16 protein [Sphingomonas pollutisoli]